MAAEITSLTVHGRHHEIAEVRELLRQADCRLATLLGPAGIGKTTLARAIGNASEQLVAFVSFEDLASVSAVSQRLRIEQALATLEIDQAPSAQTHAPLLILDSADELRDSATIVSELLSSWPTLKLLVGSRYPLELDQEWIVKVRGLDCRQKRRDSSGLTCAARMFVERARARLPGFEIYPNQRAINYICERLEGSPAGITLAADLVGTYSLPEIASRLTSELDFLSTPDVAIPARHASLRGLMDSSWEQLTDEQRNAFAQVSIFAGGFTEQAAHEITDCNRKILASLVEFFWLRLEQTRTSVRYTIHPLLRRYGLEKLTESSTDIDPLAAEMKRRHAEYFDQLLCAQAKGLSAVDDESFYKVDLEYQNLQRAWDWIRSNRSATQLVHFLDTLQLYCLYRNHRQEAARLLESALALSTLSQEQRTRWQHMLAETRGKFERMHSAERRGIPRIGTVDSTPLRPCLLKALAPPPPRRAPNSSDEQSVARSGTRS